MRIRYGFGVIGVTAALALAGIAWTARALGRQDTTVPTARPGIGVGLPSPALGGQCCLWQLHKKGEGSRQARLGPPYKCENTMTARGPEQFKIMLATEGPPCDQMPALIPDGSTLTATGETVRRADGFAHFEGPFQIHDRAGRLIFEGMLTAIDRLGSHHPPFGTEACNPEAHLEGFLTGRGVAAAGLQMWQLRSIIVARTNLPPGPNAAPIIASIDGDLMKCAQ